jgi:hypothetical protein
MDEVGKIQIKWKRSGKLEGLAATCPMSMIKGVRRK